MMRRATIPIPDDLEAFIAGQEPAPSLTRLVQTALRRFLTEKRRELAVAGRDLRPARGLLKITVAAHGSGERDVSIEHDRHLTTEA